MKKFVALLVMLLMMNCGGIMYKGIPTTKTLTDEYMGVMNDYSGAVASVVEQARGDQMVFDRCVGASHPLTSRILWIWTTKWC